MSRRLYTLLLRLLSPLLLGWLRRRARRDGSQWELDSSQRFGRYEMNARGAALPSDLAGQVSERQPQASQAPAALASAGVTSVVDPLAQASGRIWLHAVSLGETRAAQPLVQALLDQGCTLLLTHMTATGRAMGQQLFVEALESGQLRQAWIPFDLPEAVQGFLNYWRPRCGLIMERELWPNLLHEAKRQGVPMVLVSARLSVASFKQTQRFGRLLGRAYQQLTLALAQGPEDAQRLEQLGVPEVVVTGNLKFDVAVPSDLVTKGQALKRQLQRPVIVIASTREGEEALFIAAIQRALQSAIPGQKNSSASVLAPLYVLIPRHPQRFDTVRQLLQRSGLTVTSRSALGEREALSAKGRVSAPSTEILSTLETLRQTDVLLGDSIGEMFFYYALADVAIVAGSFEPLGGQNHIEASCLGLPVIVGPHTHNFKQTVEDALAAGAAQRVTTAQEAVDLASRWLEQPAQRQAMAEAAEHWLAQHQGATARTVAQLQPYLTHEEQGHDD